MAQDQVGSSHTPQFHPGWMGALRMDGVRVGKESAQALRTRPSPI